MHNHTGLPRRDLLPLCTFEAQEVTINEGCVLYRLFHVIYLCSWSMPDSPRRTSVETTSKHILLAQPINQRYRACAVRQGFALLVCYT